MLANDVVKAWRQVFSPPFRRILLMSLGLTVGLLVLTWIGLTYGVRSLLEMVPDVQSRPWIETLAVFVAGAGLFVGLAYIMPAVSAVVAGLFLDDAAEVVEKTDYAADPPGRALPIGLAVVYGLRFAALSLAVNLVALLLIFVPVVNVVAFFGANAYLLSREYFELAAGRFRPMAEARAMRKAFRPQVLAAGLVLAAMLAVPILNLLTPLFGVALMVHVHKRLERRTSRA